MDYEIRDEDDLQFYLMKRFKLGEFAKVKRISTIEISPEIDLVDVNESQKLVTGFEFKLLKYRKKWKRVSFHSMYQGIGQALSYFQFGVDKSYLVLGLSKGIPDEIFSRTIKKIEETITIFNTLRKFVTENVEKIAEKIGKLQGIIQNVQSLYRTEAMPVYDLRIHPMLEKSTKSFRERGITGIGSFGIMVWIEHDDQLMTKLEAEENFPVFSNKDLQHKKECLLRKEFRYDKNFLTRGKLR